MGRQSVFTTAGPACFTPVETERPLREDILAEVVLTAQPALNSIGMSGRLLAAGGWRASVGMPVVSLHQLTFWYVSFQLQLC